MTRLKPTDVLLGKGYTDADEAVKDAWRLLYGYGFITEREACIIDARIEKWEKDFYREKG